MRMHLHAFLISVLAGCLISTCGSEKPSKRLTADDFPHFDNGDTVEFYYIEGVFPYTTPEYIVDGSGDLWTQYSLTHAGLGVWNKEIGEKMSIEIVCEDYVGALLPTVSSNGSIHWNNTASVVMTKPMNESYWLESKLLAVSNGAAYQHIKEWVQDNHKKYAVYQPVSVYEYYPSADDGVGKLLVPFVDSYSFLHDMLQELADYGVKQKSFLDVSSTGFSYLADTASIEGGAAWRLSWEEGENPPTNVSEWYSTLNECYEETWERNIGNAGTFLEEVSECYDSGFAFVYDGPTAVLQVPLAKGSAGDGNYEAPVLWRSTYELPKVSSSKEVTWDIVDTIVVSVGALVLCVLLGGVCMRLYKKPSRRPASMKWEAKAQSLVDDISRSRKHGNRSPFDPEAHDGSGSRDSHGDVIFNYFNRPTDDFRGMKEYTQGDSDSRRLQDSFHRIVRTFFRSRDSSSFRASHSVNSCRSSEDVVTAASTYTPPEVSPSQPMRAPFSSASNSDVLVDLLREPSVCVHTEAASNTGPSSGIKTATAEAGDGELEDRCDSATHITI